MDTLSKHLKHLLCIVGVFYCCTCLGCRWGSVGQNGLGLQLYQQGRYPEALQQFELARQADPTNPDSYYNLASTYARLGQAQKDPKMLEQAEVLYNQCLELAPNHTECYRGLAVLLVETNRSDKAFTLMQNWTKSSPTLVDARVELSRLQSEFGKTKEAQQTLDEALAMDPTTLEHGLPAEKYVKTQVTSCKRFRIISSR